MTGVQTCALPIFNKFLVRSSVPYKLNSNTGCYWSKYFVQCSVMVLSNRMKPSIFVLFASFSFLTADEMIMTNAKLRGNSWFLDPLEMKDITVSV